MKFWILGFGFWIVFAASQSFDGGNSHCNDSVSFMHETFDLGFRNVARFYQKLQPVKTLIRLFLYNAKLSNQICN